MELLRMLLSRCVALFRTRALEEDLEDELRSHLDFAITEHMERGMSEAEARQAALQAFGGVTQISERYRVERGLPFFAVLYRTCAFHCGSYARRRGLRGLRF
jgi:hypothetical protein